MAGQEYHARIGQVKIGSNGDQLHALVGSCIAIGFLHKNRSICGLAHCLLPDSKSKTFEIGARYVDQAIHSLLQLMEVQPDETRALRAIVVGGGNMTKPKGSDPKQMVGVSNAQFAKKTLRQKRIRIMHEDIGGMHGRKIVIDTATNDFHVNVIPRIEENRHASE